jgi:hypothetical protein
MANVYVNLPVPIGNGVGASVVVSMMGRDKTVTYQGNLLAAVEIQFSLDGVNFVPQYTFNGPGKQTFEFAALSMRVRVSNFRGGTAANVDVGADDDGALFAVLVAPPGNGVGAAVDVSALGTFKTMLVTGTFSGALTIEASEDGIDFLPCATFAGAAGAESREFAAQFMRVRRSNVGPVAGAPVVGVGAINDTPAGVGGGDSNCLIYQPGGGDVGPVVFASWPALMAKLATLRAAANGQGCYTILFDDSFVSPAVIPAGGPYDMTDVEWLGRPAVPASAPTPVTIADGASFTQLRCRRPAASACSRCARWRSPRTSSRASTAARSGTSSPRCRPTRSSRSTRPSKSPTRTSPCSARPTSGCWATRRPSDRLTCDSHDRPPR